MGRPQDVVCRLGVSYDNLLNYNVYHPKVVANHDSFIPLKYSLTDSITQYLQESNLLFCDLWSIYHSRVLSKNSNKKVNLLVFFKSVNFSNDGFTKILLNCASTRLTHLRALLVINTRLHAYALDALYAPLPCLVLCCYNWKVKYVLCVRFN